MYEDNRTILPTGLLTQASGKTYVPRPVSFGLTSTVNKPDPTHVNPDKLLVAQQEYQQKQLELQQQALELQRQQLKQSKKGGGGSVICTHYHALGFMPDDIYRADSRYGVMLEIDHPGVMQWYWSWATWVVQNLIHGETFISQFLLCAGWPLCRSIAKEMAHREGTLKKGTIIGKLVLNTVIWIDQIFGQKHQAV